MRLPMRIIVSILACWWASASPGVTQAPQAAQRRANDELDTQREAVLPLWREAIGQALRMGIDDLFATLKISDDVEAGLLREALSGKKAGSPDALTVVLLRPAERKESMEAREFRNDEQHFRLRMTKVRTKAVTRPIGIVVYTSVRDGQMVIEESILHLGPGGKWTKE